MDELTKWYDHTCSACPDQYEGQLNDGRYFYLRYRWGSASLGLSDVSVDDAVGADRVSVSVGGGLDGMFENASQRDKVFKKLLKMDSELGED